MSKKFEILRLKARLLAAAATTISMTLVACGGGGGGGSSGASASTYTVAGSVTGLNSGTLVLQDNSPADAVTVTANGAFTFPGQLVSGAAYDVTVSQAPSGVTCTVSSGTGSIQTSNVSGVAVNCTTAVAREAALVFRSVGETTNTGSASGAITLQAVDASGNVVGPASPVSLSSTSSTMTFSATPDFASPITSVSLVTDHATFYFKDTTANSATITAATTGYASATLAETVVLTISERGTVNLVASSASSPYPVIQTADGTLYGVASLVSVPYIFKVDTLGVKTTLYTFGSDSNTPSSGLVLANDGNFYGTTGAGTATPNGGVYRLTPSGSFTVMHAFTGSAGGSNPEGGLIQATDGMLYGLTYFGGPGSQDCGTAFTMTLTGTFATLYTFAGNPDGCAPQGGLIQGSDGIFYGTTVEGGNGSGVVFSMTSAGKVVVLHALGNGDGEYPEGRLLEARDGNLYGTAVQGGPTNSRGTFFQVTKAGSFKVLYGFGTSSQGLLDGYYGGTYRPDGTVIQLADGNFYGTTPSGGAYGSGAVYQITPSGSETVVHSFQGSPLQAGIGPSAPLLLGLDGKLYGVALVGGPANAGTVFSMSGF